MRVVCKEEGKKIIDFLKKKVLFENFPALIKILDIKNLAKKFVND